LALHASQQLAPALDLGADKASELLALHRHDDVGRLLEQQASRMQRGARSGRAMGQAARLALARATSSWMFFGPLTALTTSTLGTAPHSEMNSKSPIGSQGSLASSALSAPCVAEVPTSSV
jgi:hypothetical protein